MSQRETAKASVRDHPFGDLLVPLMPDEKPFKLAVDGDTLVFTTNGGNFIGYSHKLDAQGVVNLMKELAIALGQMTDAT